MIADWNWNKPQVNRKNAEALGRAAHLAYKDPEMIQYTLRRRGMKLIQFFENQDT